MIVIINTGMANLGSVFNIVKYLGYYVIVTKNQETLQTVKIFTVGLEKFCLNIQPCKTII